LSRLNDFDCEHDIRTGLELAKAYKQMRSHLFNTCRIPKDELQVLVVNAYQNEVITTGKACELLNCDRLEFRDIL